MKTKTQTKTPAIIARGHAAIELAESSPASTVLHSYSDPTADARDGLTVAEAQEIAREDAGLIYATAALKVFCAIGDAKDTMPELRTLTEARAALAAAKE